MVASTIAALFGLANLFARGMGGMVSDSLFRMLGFLGRMWAQMICLLGIGIACMILGVSLHASSAGPARAGDK